MAKTMLTTTGLVAGFAAFLAVNLLADRSLTSARADLTDTGLYTVSDGAKRVVAGLEEPVTLRLYYSAKIGNNLPSIRPYAQRVRGLLEEYAAGSRGQLRLEVIDPEPFSEQEDAAVAAGIRGMRASEAGDVLFFGIEVSGSTDQREVIDFLSPSREASLEYDVTRIISRLGHPDRKVLAIVSALPLSGRQAMPWEGGGGEEPYTIYDELQSDYDVRMVPPGATELPADTELLMVAHPKGITDELLFAIDQFVLKGGHALFFVDPFCQSDRPPSDPNDPMSQFTADRASNLDRLLNAWGVTMEPGVFAADRGTALPIPYGERQQPVPHVWYERLGPDNFDKDDFVTAMLPSLLLSTPGVLARQDGASTELTPLVQTSADSQTMSTSAVQFMPDPGRILAEFVPGGQPLTIAARLQGTVKSAFPKGKPVPPQPPQADGSEPPPPPPDPGFVAESQAPINVVIVADADLLADDFWVQKQRLFPGGPAITTVHAGNGDFVVAALDNLAGSNDLLSVRPRASIARPFERIDELRREADQKFAQSRLQLEAKLRETEQKLTELQAQKAGGEELILSPEQRAEIEQFQLQERETRKALRDVQLNLNRDIDHVKTWIKVVNIGLVPALLCIAALALLGWRRQRRA